MRITIYTDYALRLLMYLALKEDGLATIAEIAATYDISRNHLMKVAYELVIAGYVVSVRGRGGGLRLAMPAEAITLGDVVRKTEPDMAIVQCMKPDDTSCALFPACVLRRAMKLAGTAFVETLDRYTLGDLIEPAVKLRALIGISQGGGDLALRSTRVARALAHRPSMSRPTRQRKAANPRKAGKKRMLTAAGISSL
jgi:Rrf2 family transcriptional regulator, nitric oxide-sensitive transcriptional repressor